MVTSHRKRCLRRNKLLFLKRIYLPTFGANTVEHDLEAWTLKPEGFGRWSVLCRIFEGKKFIAAPARKVHFILTVGPFVSGVSRDIPYMIVSQCA